MRQIIPETDAEFDDLVVTERPDGFYWRTKVDAREYGPFESLLAAVEDAESRSGETGAGGEGVAEAEAEFGMSDWIDEETGEPAEENAPRLEQH
ncbi:MAG TPA: hypothetical protein VF816_08365 [Rhodocyclaceae bacterium]